MGQHRHNDGTNSDPEEDDIQNYYPGSRPASAPNMEQNPRRRQRADSEEEQPHGDVGRSFTTLMHSLLAPAFASPRPQGAQQNNSGAQQNQRPAPNPNRPTLPFDFFGPGTELGGLGHNHRPGAIVTTRIVLSNGQGPPVTHVYGNLPGAEPAPDLATYVRPLRAHPNVLINNSASALPSFGTPSYPSEIMDEDEAPAIPPSVGNPNTGGALVAVPRPGPPAAIPGALNAITPGALQRPRLARYNTRVLVIVVRGPADDARRLFTELMTNMGGPAGAPGQEGQQRPRGDEAGDNPFAGASPFQALLAALLNPGQAEHGDAVYTQEALDRVITRLMEEHQSSGAAPPAPREAIDKLPLKKLDAKMLGEEGKATCPVCMEDVVLDEEVVELPCKHWFHEECGKTWLNNHNTCPICRKSITGDAPHDHGNNNSQNNHQNQGWDSIPRAQSSSNAPQNGAPPPYAPPAFTFFNSGPRRTSNESRPERRDRLDSIRRAGGVTYENDDPPLNIPGSFRYEPPSERAVRPADGTPGGRSFADPNSGAFRDFLNAPAVRLPDHEDRHAEQRAGLRLRRENSFPLSRERNGGGRSMAQHNPYIDNYGDGGLQPYRPADNNGGRESTTPSNQGRNSDDRGSRGSNGSNNSGGGGITGVLGGIWRRFSGQNNGNGQGR